MARRICVLAILFLLVTAASARESISVRWKRQVNKPICLAMSASGNYYGSIDSGGTVRLYDRQGKELWRQRIQGATDMLIARDGESVLVYSRLNPVYRDVYFFRGDGTRLWKQHLDGCVWSGAVSPNGRHAAVTTGDKYLYIYKPDPNRPKYRRWRLPGIGRSIIFTPDSERVIACTWQESVLACYDREGTLQWSNPLVSERQYRLHVSGDGRTVLGLLPGSRYNPDLSLMLWDKAGKRLWSKPMHGFDGCALVSPQSQYIALSYADFISRQNPDLVERKVAVFKADGTLWWEKGGLFFSPRLVALSPSGARVIVWDGERSLYNIDRRGKILSKLTLKSDIAKTLPSEEGDQILVYCDAGWLYLLDVK
ncbi:MAG: WD40 repeat domain-containing protein [Armatimonadota bacterium]